MTGRPFLFSEDLLQECAGSGLAAFVGSRSSSDVEDGGFWRPLRTPAKEAGDRSCLELFNEYSDHFGRESSRDDFFLERNPPESDREAGSLSYRVSKRLASFVRSVSFVYQHNKEVSDGGYGHSVTLNRFSDLSPSDVIASVASDGNEHGNEGGRHLLETQDDWDFFFFDDDDDDFQSTWGADFDLGLLTTLTTSEMIRDVENLGIGKGSMNKLNPKHKKTFKNYEDDISPNSVYLPLDDQEPRFETPEVKGLHGSLMSIKESESHRHDRKHREKHLRRRNGMDAGNSTDADKWIMEDLAGDSFADYLNWASTANPDGVSIVHDAFDQGGCGSCWAYAATGSLEASASRKAAFDALHYYTNKYPDRMNATGVNDGLDEGIAFAQQIERDSILAANLSIQELLDCDQVADQGCTGGNPLLAFYFIHRFGLTSWSDYPYVGYRDECHKDLVKDPIATVKSWGIISPNHERHMELALRYIGPVAVGVNGANRHFLAYSGGVFDRPNCKQGANHALLITGYGQEETVNGTTIKYWIARNSWGPDWGENGYVRIRRGEGSKGIPGVCGIARSPSVALGGALIGRATPSFAAVVLLSEKNAPIDNGEGNDICNHFVRGQGVCDVMLSWVDSHESLCAALLGVGLAMLAVFPLTRDCRRRRRRRKQRRQRQQSKERNGHHVATEKEPLVDNNGQPESYGTETAVQANDA